MCHLSNFTADLYHCGCRGDVDDEDDDSDDGGESDDDADDCVCRTC